MVFSKEESPFKWVYQVGFLFMLVGILRSFFAGADIFELLRFVGIGILSSGGAEFCEKIRRDLNDKNLDAALLGLYVLIVGWDNGKTPLFLLLGVLVPITLIYFGITRWFIPRSKKLAIRHEQTQHKVENPSPQL
jgi:uncharacterized membrane protein HdeD (DUF308 family)